MVNVLRIQVSISEWVTKETEGEKKRITWDVEAEVRDNFVAGNRGSTRFLWKGEVQGQPRGQNHDCPLNKTYTHAARPVLVRPSRISTFTGRGLELNSVGDTSLRPLNSLTNRSEAAAISRRGAIFRSSRGNFVESCFCFASIKMIHVLCTVSRIYNMKVDAGRRVVGT